MKNIQSLSAWLSIPLALWCLWLHGQLNSLVARTKENLTSEQQKEVQSNLRDLELALGLVPARKLERDGLSRLSVIESRIQMIEKELASQPVGTLITVVQPQSQAIADGDPQPTKTKKEEINAFVPTLKEEIQKTLAKSNWRPAENGEALSPREYPEAAQVYSGHPNDTANFTLKYLDQRTFVRLKQFMPASEGMFNGGRFQIRSLTPVKDVKGLPAQESPLPK